MFPVEKMADEIKMFGWGCYWKLKSKDDQINALKQIITECTCESAKQKLKQYEQIIVEIQKKKEERKAQALVRKLQNNSQQFYG